MLLYKIAGQAGNDVIPKHGAIEINLRAQRFTMRTLSHLMTAEDQKATCENTARAMADSEIFIKQRHIRNCFRAYPSYGKGVAEALGLSLEEALIADDPAHPKWDDR